MPLNVTRRTEILRDVVMLSVFIFTDSLLKLSPNALIRYLDLATWFLWVLVMVAS